MEERRFDKFLVFEKISNLASELETSLERNKHSKYEFTYSVYKFLVGPEMIKMKNGIMTLHPTGFEDFRSVDILVGFIVEILTDVVFESSIQRLKRNQLSDDAIEKELEDCLLTDDLTNI
mmetsp:Transcript_15639/g.20418  ORF Transcript_15639/g.20418 Transcript_15639/m.20418 type:complete len:120 (-) Transcript_15639:2758-3117(-)